MQSWGFKLASLLFFISRAVFNRCPLHSISAGRPERITSSTTLNNFPLSEVKDIAAMKNTSPLKPLRCSNHIHIINHAPYIWKRVLNIFVFNPGSHPPAWESKWKIWMSTRTATPRLKKHQKTEYFFRYCDRIRQTGVL